MYFLRFNWGEYVSLRGNDLLILFCKIVIFYFDILLKLFNYYYFVLLLWSYCDLLFRVFGFFVFYLFGGGRSGGFLCDLGFVILGI